MKLLRYHREDFVSFGIGILMIAAVCGLASFGL